MKGGLCANGLPLTIVKGNNESYTVTRAAKNAFTYFRKSSSPLRDPCVIFLPQANDFFTFVFYKVLAYETQKFQN